MNSGSRDAGKDPNWDWKNGKYVGAEGYAALFAKDDPDKIEHANEYPKKRQQDVTILIIFKIGQANKGCTNLVLSREVRARGARIKNPSCSTRKCNDPRVPVFN